MIKRDLHLHTVFSDGKNTPEEMVLSAISKGLKVLGFSTHSYTFFDERYCIAKNKISEYKDTVYALKEKYKDKINILCGVEQDYYSAESVCGYDYVIGSVHYLYANGQYLSIDDSAEDFKRCLDDHFGGDVYNFCEIYYKTVEDVVNKTNADIIGHFDLISKYNDGNSFFDEKHPRYVAAYKKAIDKLIPFNVPFEINTGAISRGYKSFPYPNADMVDYINEKGGKFILSGDSHQTDTIAYEFDKWEKYAINNELTLL